MRFDSLATYPQLPFDQELKLIRQRDALFDRLQQLTDHLNLVFEELAAYMNGDELGSIDRHLIYDQLESLENSVSSQSDELFKVCSEFCVDLIELFSHQTVGKVRPIFVATAA